MLWLLPLGHAGTPPVRAPRPAAPHAPSRPRASRRRPRRQQPCAVQRTDREAEAAVEAILISIIIVIGGVGLGRFVVARRRRGPKETPACGGVSVPGVTLVARRALVRVAMVNNSFLRLNEKSLSRFD